MKSTIRTTEEAELTSPSILVHVSPYILLRIAALPYRYLRQASLEDTWATVQFLQRIESELGEINVLAFDEIDEMIPLAADSKIRGLMVTLRRSAHSGGYVKKKIDIESARTFLRYWGEKKFFLRWLDLQEMRLSLLNTAETKMLLEMDLRTRPTMLAALSDPSFSNGLSRNAPRLYHKVISYGDWNFGKSSNKSERSLMNYLTRAAAKTSPLGTFMFTVWVPIDKQAKRSTFNTNFPAVPFTKSTINRGVVSRLSRYTLRDWSYYKDPVVSPNFSLRRQSDGKLQAIVSTNVELLGRAWRQDRLASITLPAGVAEVLLSFKTEMTITQLSELFAKYGIDQPNSINWIKQFLLKGLVYQQTTWNGLHGDPLKELISSLQNHGTSLGKNLCFDLYQLEKLIDGSDHIDPAEAARVSSKVDFLVQQSQNTVGARFTKPFNSNISQDASLNGITGNFGEAMAELMKKFGLLLSEHITISLDYLRILELFINAYGTGGRCDNLMDFLMNNYSEFELSKIGRNRPLSINNLSIGLTVYFQLIAADLDELESGNARIVANLIYERAGWQSARYLTLDESGRAVMMMYDWLRDLADGTEPVEINICGGVNSLQAHVPITDRVLDWPGENFNIGLGATAVDPRKVCVVHDASKNSFNFFDADGKEIKLMYMGGVMPMPSWGIAFMLVKMTEPLTIKRPHHLLKIPVGDGIEVQPRVEQGKITLFRKSWKVPSSVLTGIFSNAKGFELLKRVCDFFLQNEIPKLTYVSGEILFDTVDSQALNLDKLRKPNWLDIANPICVDLLKRLVFSCEWITFREAFPDENNLWLSINGESHVSELQAELRIQITDI